MPTASPVHASFISAVSDNSSAMSCYTRWSILVSALILSRLDYCNSVLTAGHRTAVVNSRTTAESRTLQLDMSWVCRHVSRDFGAKGAQMFAGALPHPVPADSADVQSIRLTLGSVLYTSEILWCWRVRTPVGTVFALPTPPTTLFHERGQGLGRAFYVAGPAVWNSLPESLRPAGSISSVKRQLKAHF